MKCKGDRVRQVETDVGMDGQHKREAYTWLIKSRHCRTPDTGMGETVKSELLAPCKQVSLLSLLVQLVSPPKRHGLNKASGLDEDCTQTVPISLPPVPLWPWLKPLYLMKLC